MQQALASTRLWSCLFLGVIVSACDGSGSSASPGSTDFSQVGPSSRTAPGPGAEADQGAASVAIVINQRPVITAMQSSAGGVDSNLPVTLQVAATDPDGDALSFVWKSSCPGSFDRTDLAQVTFTPGTLAGTVSCTFAVGVSDGHGGSCQGTLVLSTTPPKIIVAPIMGIAYQSTANARAGEVVALHASASDPEGGALTWTWQAAVGSLSQQSDGAGSSDVQWTAPMATGLAYPITVTATDPEQASASFVFRVNVTD